MKLEEAKQILNCLLGRCKKCDEEYCDGCYIDNEDIEAIETKFQEIEHLQKENEELRSEILRLENDIDYWVNNSEELESRINDLEEYITELENKQEGLHDICNFKRQLEIKGLMTEQLDEFIENYMRWCNSD